MNEYENKIHRWGRLSTSLAIVLFLSFPLFVSIYYNAWPGWGPFLSGLLGVAPIFWVVGAIEAFTFGPMLGSGGSYLGFVTGNLTNLKVPAALNAMQSMGVEPNTEEGDVVCTIAVAVSSIVTTLVLIVGMLLLAPLQPILQSPVLSPAFDNILPALFGALAVVFISKNWKIALSPLILMLVLFIAVPSLSSAVSILVPVGAIFTLCISRLLYKKGMI
ncbi:MAG TPA: hypothetical protein PK466_11275 [Thermotogota bacterium]|nr:hypothetical protein [Thermotogota bacterium]HPJ89835.1 hypothetical protein [Thermotogota bacterium]HPR96908.1 hypothetical protein [Thermotogota bacterium]